MSLRPVLAAFLSVVLLVSALASGAARGQLPVAGEVEICLGGAAVSVSLDADGQPRRQLHLCPDGALLALAGFPVPAPVLLPPDTRTAAAVAPFAAMPSGTRRPLPLGARAPPSAIFRA